jgi:hypothetical protein
MEMIVNFYIYLGVESIGWVNVLSVFHKNPFYQFEDIICEVLANYLV